jgi:bacillithiol system protein YtxJ
MKAPVAVETMADLDRLLEDSHRRPVVLLKHSTRCAVSAMAHEEFLRFASGLENGRASAAIVRVIESRAVSDEVARRLEVSHRSPQAIVVVAGRAVWHDSHLGVAEDNLLRALDEATRASGRDATAPRARQEGGQRGLC